MINHNINHNSEDDERIISDKHYQSLIKQSWLYKGLCGIFAFGALNLLWVNLDLNTKLTKLEIKHITDAVQQTVDPSEVKLAAVELEGMLANWKGGKWSHQGLVYEDCKWKERFSREVREEALKTIERK